MNVMSAPTIPRAAMLYVLSGFMLLDLCFQCFYLACLAQR